MTEACFTAFGRFANEWPVANVGKPVKAFVLDNSSTFKWWENVPRRMSFEMKSR